MNAAMTPETTTDTSTAEQTILDCQAKSQALERERLNIAERLASAAGEIETIQGEILSKERTFTPADQRDLPKLRSKRTELTQMVDDLRGLLPQIEHEIRSVIEQAADAHRMLASREYNMLAERQREITQAMADALETFQTAVRDALAEKRDMAVKQQDIAVQRMGVPAPAVDVETLISLYKRDLVSVMSGSQVSIEYSAQRQDWTTRTMSETGELGARP